MKKLILTACGTTIAAMALFAGSDRIDITRADGTTFSVMTDAIRTITVGKDATATAEDGYSTVTLTAWSGEVRTARIADLTALDYVPYNRTDLFQISFGRDEHSHVQLLDCRNNDGIMDPTKPDDWRAAVADEQPHFWALHDKGYSSTYTITGDYTGTDYTATPGFVFESKADDNLLGVDCLTFLMPFEPVTMTSVSTINTTYDGAPFLGTYRGYELAPGADSRLTVLREAPLTMEFRGNATYVVKTTDANAFDILDLYTWDEEKNAFAYVPYDGPKQNEVDVEIKTGVSGRFVNDGYLFADFNSILHDTPENTRHYFAGRDGFTYTLASADAAGFRQLMEAAPADGAPFYYYLESYATKRTPVSLQFLSGTTIGAPCEAYAVADGEKIFKYRLVSGGEPEFILRGSEAGTYTGEGDDLVLDGFGNATSGSLTGTYTIDGGRVTVSIGGETETYLVDAGTHTYTHVVAAEWTGSDVYTCDEVLGAYMGGTENRDNSVRILIDQNVNGTPNPGTAAVIVTIARHDGFGTIDAIASSGKYTYDPAAGTLTIANVYAGTSATTSGRRNIVLCVNDDLTALWFDSAAGDRLYSASRDGSYVVTGPDNTFRCEKPSVPALAAGYSASLRASMFGMDLEAETTLTLDAASGKATLVSTAMGSPLLNATVDYTLDGTTLTLKGVEVGDGGGLGVNTDADITFTLQPDGTLLGEGIYYSSNISFAAIAIDFASVPFAPAE